MNDDIRIRLLLVDDDEEFLSITAKVLERRGIDVIVANCGENAQTRIFRVNRLRSHNW